MCTMETKSVADTPRVSVIVPVYNRRDYVRLTLESIRAQTFTDYEVIVVDDGSTDGSVDVAQEFAAADPRFRSVTQENAGCATARNHGLTLSSPESEFIIFLDSDDLWTPDALESLVYAAEKSPNAALVYSPIENIVFIDDAGNVQERDPVRFQPYSEIFSQLFGRRVTREDCDSAPLLYMATCCFILTPGSALIRKAALNGMQFDTSISIIEDWEFWVRFSEGRQFQHLTNPIYHYRMHDGSISKNYARKAMYLKMAYHKLGCSEALSPENRKLARQAFKKHPHYQILLVRGWRRQELKERHWANALRLSLRILKFRLRALKATS